MSSAAASARRSMARPFPTPTIVETAGKTTTATCFIIHGLGDTADGWVDVAESLHQTMPHVKFILPTARTVPVTLNGGARMPAWYDIEGLSLRAEEPCHGLDESCSYIQSLVKEEVKRGIAMNRIVVGGFSQGGALSLWTGFSLDEALAGIVCLSGYMVRPKSFVVKHPTVPLFMGHGMADDVVKFEFAISTEKALREKGVQSIEFKQYPGMPHTVTPSGIRDLHGFLTRVLPPLDASVKKQRDEM